MLRALQDASGPTGAARGEDSHGRPGLAGQAPEPTVHPATGRRTSISRRTGSQAKQDSRRCCVSPPCPVLSPAALPASGCSQWPPQPVCTACLEQTADRPGGQMVRAWGGFLDLELPRCSRPRPCGRSPEATLPARPGVGVPPRPAPPTLSPWVGRRAPGPGLGLAGSCGPCREASSGCGSPRAFLGSGLVWALEHPPPLWLSLGSSLCSLSPPASPSGWCSRRPQGTAHAGARPEPRPSGSRGRSVRPETPFRGSPLKVLSLPESRRGTEATA